MNKGKLYFYGSTKKLDITRIFINPWHKESDRIADKKWNAYEGNACYLRSGKDTINFTLIDENGKDISNKIKNSNKDWQDSSVPLTLQQRLENNKKNTNFFGKEKDFTDYLAVSSYAKTYKKSDEIIKSVIEKVQSEDEKYVKENFLKMILKEALADKQNADIAVEQFNSLSDITFSVEYEIEWNDKFDFKNLFFVNLKFPLEGILSTNYNLNEDSKLLGVIVYDGKLFFGKVSLFFPDEIDYSRIKEYKILYSDLFNTEVLNEEPSSEIN